MALSESEILKVLELFDRSGWNEMQLESGGVKLRIAKSGRLQETPAAPRPASVGTPVEGAPMAATSRNRHEIHSDPISAAGARSSTAVGAVAAPPAAAAATNPRWIAVKAPMLGHFYAAPKPGAPPFVTVGETVAADDTVAILEVMKLMNHVKAGVAGQVARIDVVNGDLVEFDQTMVYIDPA